MTWAILGANALTFVARFIGGVSWPGLLFYSPAFLPAPWTALTYPLVGAGDALWLLLGGYMVWLFGGSLERAWGWRDYTVFLLLVSGATAVALWLASVLLGRGAFLAGFGMPLAAMTVAWATVNPFERLMLYFVLPLEARWLGILAAVLVLFSLPFPLGVFALAGCGTAVWYVREGRYLSVRTRGVRRHPERSLTLNPLAWYRRWRQKRRFMRLVKGSSLRDDDTLH